MSGDTLFGRLERKLADAQLADRQQWAAIEILLDILENAGITKPPHRRLFEKIKENRPPEIRVRLSMYEDKYEIPGADIDCASRMHLCHGRCCSFAVALTRQDLEERELDWDIEHPYLLPRRADSYCGYIDRDTGGCTTYQNRPAVCRKYDCRDDDRVWKDFDAKIPAETPDAVLTFPGESE